MWLFYLNLYLAIALCQQCQIPSRSDLVDSTSTGLLSLALASTQFTSDQLPASASPQVQLHNFTIVCLAVAPVLGTYRSVSLVANISCSGVEMCLNSISQTVQVELECTGLSVWRPSDLSSSLGEGRGEVSLISPADATLDTSVRGDCSSCLSPQNSQSAIPDPLNHCVCKYQNQEFPQAKT